MHIVEAARKYKKIRRKSWDRDSHLDVYEVPCKLSAREMTYGDDWEEYVEPEKLSAVEQIQAEAKYRQARETGDFFGTYIDSNKPASAWKKFSEEKPMATKGLVFDLSTSILVRSYTGGGHRAEIATYFEGALTIGCHLLDQSQYEWCYIPE